MKNTLLLLLVAMLGLVVLGFYRGWFSTETSTQDHKTNVNFSVDRDKIQDDVNALKKKAGGSTATVTK